LCKEGLLIDYQWPTSVTYISFVSKKVAITDDPCSKKCASRVV
jgi:hypothetical protein